MSSKQTVWKSVPDRVSGSSGSIQVLGDDIIGVAVSDAATGQQLAAQLRQSERWLDVVAGIDSVAVRFDLASIDIDSARRELDVDLRASRSMEVAPAVLVEVPVCYGGKFGPDLDSICESLALSPEQLIELHTSREYSVDMLGFTPGFAYIGGLPAELDVPRLEKPRQHVAAGSVGIADRRTGVYAMAGPGGWPLIGRTPMRLFDAQAAEPFRLGAGARIRFKPIEASQFSSPEQS